MTRSHVSLRDDFQVSCQELDLKVQLAEQEEGLQGACRTAWQNASE
jgi:galactokinase